MLCVSFEKLMRIAEHPRRAGVESGDWRLEREEEHSISLKRILSTKRDAEKAGRDVFPPVAVFRPTTINVPLQSQVNF